MACGGDRLPVPVQRGARSSQGSQVGPQVGSQSQARQVKTVVRSQQSLITRIYINLRWFHHFVPLLGLVLMIYGIYLCVTEPEDIMVGQTVIVGGALISYLAIYYNKTR